MAKLAAPRWPAHWQRFVQASRQPLAVQPRMLRSVAVRGTGRCNSGARPPAAHLVALLPTRSFSAIFSELRRRQLVALGWGAVPLECLEETNSRRQIR